MDLNFCKATSCIQFVDKIRSKNFQLKNIQKELEKESRIYEKKLKSLEQDFQNSGKLAVLLAEKVIQKKTAIEEKQKQITVDLSEMEQIM